MTMPVPSSSAERLPTSAVQITSSERLERLTLQFASASSPGELQELITAVDSATKTVRAALAADTPHQAEAFRQETRRLEVTRAGIASTLQSSGQLCGIIADANAVGTKLTARVRVLDQEKAKVSLTQAYVADILTLKQSVARAHESIERRDWPVAAAAIAQARALPERVTNGRFANMVVPSTDIPQPPSVILQTWCDALVGVFSREFQAAAAAKDVPKLTSFFSLFPCIGESAAGLDHYARFICGIIAEQSRALLTNTPQAGLWYAAVMMKLFENIAMVVTQHGPLVARYYGPSAMAEVLPKIQREVDSQVGLILDTFHDVKGLPRTVHVVEEYSYPFLADLGVTGHPRSSTPLGGAEGLREEVSVVEVGELISELAAMLNKWAMYCRFLAGREAGPETELVLPAYLKTSALVNKLPPFTRAFDVLGTYYLRRSLEKAYQLEELPVLKESDLIAVVETDLQSPDQPPMSSVVEDLILVLNTALRHAFETGQPQMAGAMTVAVKRILDADFLNVMVKRMRELAPRSGYQFTSPTPAARGVHVGGMLRRGADYASSVLNTDTDERLSSFLLLLNSVTMASTYVGRIVQKVTEDLMPTYPFSSDGAKLHTISQAWVAAFQTKSAKVVEFNLQVLYDSAFKARLRSMVNDYFLSSEYLIARMDDNRVEFTRFVKAWVGLVAPYLRTLAKETWESLMTLVVEQLAALLEAKLWALDKRVNELGSVKLEANVSGLIDYVTQFGRYALKDAFLKVTQIVLMVGFDDEDESEVNWILTPRERERAKALRVDQN